MFSNLRPGNVDGLQTSERILHKSVSNAANAFCGQIRPQYDEKVNKLKVPVVETDLINLLNESEMSSKDDKDKAKNINDLQLKELENFLSNSCKREKTFVTTEREKEYEIFFDKYERKSKESNIVIKTENNIKELRCDTQSNPYFTGIPKVLIPKIYQGTQEPNEDIIEEVLLEKNFERKQLHKITNLRKINNEGINLKCSKIASSFCDKNGVENNDIMNQIVATNNITYISPKVTNRGSFLTSQCNLLQKQDIPKQHLNISIDELVSKYNLTYLDVLKVDDKLLKQNTFKTEAEKVHLTPGPSLQYKSIVLPQIMKRLAEKKQTRYEQANWNQKLVLDTPTENISLHIKSSIKSNGLAADVHLENRNSLFQNDYIKKSDEMTVNFNATSKMNQMSLASGTKNINETKRNDSGVQRVNMCRDSRFIHIDELKALKREKILAEKNQGAVRDVTNVLRPPQSLMVDCNKERFVANATSQLIKDFINEKF